MRIYPFGNRNTPVIDDPVGILGGKGAGLAQMSRLGLPVPMGFTIPASVAAEVHGDPLPEALILAIDTGIAHIEAVHERRLDDADAPLLLSVRSGAAVSMPGMMDTLLNVGCTPGIQGALAAQFGPHFAFDCERRYLEMHVESALGGPPAALRDLLDEICAALGVDGPASLPTERLPTVLEALRKEARRHGELPTTARTQVHAAVAAVFASWNNRRAVQYRRAHGIAADLGTAVTIQAMVFGNAGPDSATGVAFTRHPNSGERRLFGEYLPGAQGEDVVSGRFTPFPLAEADSDDSGPTLEAAQPALFGQLEQIARVLEAASRDAQEIEFTIEGGTLWLLQTRTAERAARAATRIAVEMAEEGLIEEDEALGRVRAEQLHRLLHPSVDVQTRRKVIGRGLPASPGAVSGQLVFDPDEAIARSAAGERIILARVETDTADLEAIRATVGVLTSRGGMTSHAALVARGLGRCCVTGCSDLIIDERAGRMRSRREGLVLEKGAWITLDGGTGEVLLGEVATRPAKPPAAFHTLMGWADARRTLSIRANADQAPEAEAAFERGAEGIGLCRTEHMFLAPDRVGLVRELVLADRPAARRAVVERMLPVQRSDFRSLLEVSAGRKVAIRLLDIPLHDFVTEEGAELERLAERLNSTPSSLRSRARLLRASNPLLGHRGCRVGLTFPEVYEIQARALFEAALDTRFSGFLQIVLPLVVCAQELERLKRRLARIAAQVGAERGQPVPAYGIGPMIESPRACLVAGQLAQSADFFLFGSNDLTIATFNMHRDDSARFLPFYVEHGVLEADPFAHLDEGGVVPLIALAIDAARRVKPDLECGLSGAQTADPRTIERCHQLGMDFVSVSPHRVPIARLAAAQAAVGVRV